MRLLSSLTAAAAVLADQAADRLDTWVENTAGATEAPRKTPLGFTPATGTDAPDPEAIINAAATRGLAGEQRDRWLAEVKGRLDVSTGGPWCTEERDTPTGRLISPYGVIATGVTREADRDLIENARGDLYGMLALAEHDDKVIEAWENAAKSHAARRTEAERELQGMHYRERQVDKVVAAWDTKRAGLNGYDGTIDPETPAGRVVELLSALCKARPLPNQSIENNLAALTAIENNLTEHGLARGEGDYPDVIVDAVRLALADRCEALATITELERKLAAHHRHDPAAERELEGMKQREAAVERVLDSLVDGRLKLDEYIDRETPAGRVVELVTTLLTQVHDAENGAQVQHLTDALHVANSNNAAMKQELDRARALLEAAQQDGTASHLEVAAVMGAYDRGLELADIDVREDSLAERVLGALIVERGRASDIEGKLDRYHRYDAEAITDVDAVRAAAAARVREAADLADQAIAATPVGNDFAEAAVDSAAADAFVAGLRAAADIVLDQDPEADPNVAHIDTVNGRAEYTPGPFAEAILATGGTIVVDDNGDPQVADIPLGIPTGPGTLITSDGKRHRFTSGTAVPIGEDTDTDDR